MGKSKKDNKAIKAEDAAVDDVDTAIDEATEAARDDDSNEMSDAEKVVLDAERIRIKINVAVNGHQPGDRLVVDRSHPFYGALLTQNLAEVVGD